MAGSTDRARDRRPILEARKRRRPKRPEVELLEVRNLLSGFRPIDEVGNNVANPNWGAAPADQAGGAPIQLLRESPVAYADGIGAPSLPNNPSARLVSNVVDNQLDPKTGVDFATVDQNSLSDFGYAFGQFIDHDMDLTPDSGASFPIPVPAGDPIGGPNDTPLPFTRSKTDPNTGTSTDNPRQQVNVITAYLDLSQVYGSSKTVSDALRTFSGGLLVTSPGNLLPYDNLDYFTQAQIDAFNMANDSQAVPESALFAAGDRRANENIELTALQTLFVRNHDRIAGILQTDHPAWSDEQLFQEARKLNIAAYEQIVYKEWIPSVLGPNALAAYKGYNSGVDASISTEFSTVAFRFGHSLLSGNIERHGNDGQDIADVAGSAALALSQDFFDPCIINPNGVIDPLTGHTSSDIGAILKGDADGVSQAMDTQAIEDVRNLLFGNGLLGGQDLMARDIQRARDDGIGTYNQVRVAYGLKPVTSFAQITSNVTVQNELKAAYGTVDNIDPFEGGLAEDHVAGSDAGPLFQAIMVDQFARLRDGDRYFYLNQSFNREEQNILGQSNTLTKVIEANTDVTNLQSNAFVFKASISGTVFLDLDGDGGSQRFFEPGVPGVKLQLQDGSGNVLATTTTDLAGKYSFNQLSGPAANPDNASGVSATGDYNIVLVLPSFLQQTTPNPSTILVSRGGFNITGVNFGVNLNVGDKAAALASTAVVITAQPTVTAGTAPVQAQPPATPVAALPAPAIAGGQSTAHSGASTNLSGGSDSTTSNASDPFAPDRDFGSGA
jgi:hypothetical protein